MKSLLAFSLGTILAAICLLPLALVATHAILAAAVTEADARSARQIKALMHQVRPGIVECKHEDNTLNCTQVKRGKKKPVVLATARE